MGGDVDVCSVQDEMVVGTSADENLAVLLSIFEEIPIEDLVGVLRETNQQVEAAIELLLSRRSNANVKRKSAGSIADFFVSPRKKAKPMDETDKSRSLEDLPPKPSEPSNEQQNAFEILQTASRAMDESKWSGLPPKRLSVENVADHIPCELFLNVLPPALADSLLERMLVEADTWTSRRFLLFDRMVDSPHTTCFYEDVDRTLPGRDEAPGDATGLSFYYGGKRVADVRPMFSDFTKARDIIEERVNERMAIRDAQTGGRHELELSGRWMPNIAAANCYQGHQQAVGAHTDKMTYIGPRPTIGSLTLGATRPFRVRAVLQRPGGPLPQTFNIMLPHNSLLIMFPPMQEEYKHEVPKCNAKLLTRHPISKDTRINITFRVARQEYANTVPRCRCGNPCELRPVIKQEHSLGRYFYMCGGEKGNCGHFEWLKLENGRRIP